MPTPFISPFVFFQIDLLKQRQATLIKQNEHCRASYENALSVVHDAHAAWINITNKNNGFGSLRETLVLIDQLRERLDVSLTPFFSNFVFRHYYRYLFLLLLFLYRYHVCHRFFFFLKFLLILFFFKHRIDLMFIDMY